MGITMEGISRLLELNGGALVSAVITHLQYVLISVGFGLAGALVLAVILSRMPNISGMVLPLLGVFQTIPGLVFIGVLFMHTGMRPITVIIALSVYALFPILKNTYAGILAVPEATKEAARGCGMNPLQVLLKVELPLAMASIFAGVRMATIYTVSWAVLAAMIGLGGLGEFVYRGIETNNQVMILGGAIPASIMAVALGILVDKLEAKITPRGLKGTSNG